MFEELGISSNQIKVLPDSFAMLKGLHVLHVGEIPLEYLPIHIAEKEAQAIVQYMFEEIAKREEKSQETEPKRKNASYFQNLITSLWTKRNAYGKVFSHAWYNEWSQCQRGGNPRIMGVCILRPTQ